MTGIQLNVRHTDGKWMVNADIQLCWLLFAAIQALLNDIHALGCWSSTEVR